MGEPLNGYIRAAVNADLHVQVEVERIELPPGRSGEAMVVGRVARVFRGTPKLVSSRVSFGVSCCREVEDSPPGVPPWTRMEDLERARVLETYLDRDGAGGFFVPHWRYTIVNEVTDTPVMVVTEEELRILDEDGFGSARSVPRTGARRFLYELVHDWPFLLVIAGSLAVIGYFVWALLEWQRAP